MLACTCQEKVYGRYCFARSAAEKFKVLQKEKMSKNDDGLEFDDEIKPRKEIS